MQKKFAAHFMQLSGESDRYKSTNAPPDYQVPNAQQARGQWFTCTCTKAAVIKQYLPSEVE